MRESALISLCPRNHALFSSAECAEPEVPLRCDSYEGWHSRQRRAGSPWLRRPGPPSIFCRTFPLRGFAQTLGFERPEKMQKALNRMATVLKMTDFIALQVPGCHVVLAIPNIKTLWSIGIRVYLCTKEGSTVLQSSSLPITITYLQAKW
jgi:hypothetical protein